MTAQDNPSSPPRSDAGVTNRPRSLELAGRGRRFGTFVVDIAGHVLLGGLLGALIGVVEGLTSGVDEVSAIEQGPQLIDFVAAVLTFFAYYMFFEGIWARTPGKWLFGTVVVRDSGGKPSLGQVLGRTACRLIPFEPFSLFFGLVGWHDRIPGTRVVRASRSS
jgi:uncharacterized RDD family membrane protein YckC